VQTGKTVWETSIFPDSRSGGVYILPLKASESSIRAFAGAMAKGLSVAEPRVTVTLAVS